MSPCRYVQQRRTTDEQRNDNLLWMLYEYSIYIYIPRNQANVWFPTDFKAASISLQRRFPVDNLAEWNNGHPLGLRTVQAYVLVFDMANPETFLVCISSRKAMLFSSCPNGMITPPLIRPSLSLPLLLILVLSDDARPDPGELFAPRFQYFGNRK